MNYIVSFDINKETKPDYQAAHKKVTDLLRAANGKRVNFSVWLISSHLGPRALYQILTEELDNDDSLVIGLCPASFLLTKNPLEEVSAEPLWPAVLLLRQLQRRIRRGLIRCI